MLPKYHKIMGHHVSVIASLVSFDENGDFCLIKKNGETISRDGYKVLRLRYKRLLYPVNKIIRRYEKTFISIKEENPDIIFIHGCQFWDIKKIRDYKRRNRNVKIFVDNHADFNNSASNWISKQILHKVIWRHCAKSIEGFTEKFYGVTPNRCAFLEDVYKVGKNKIELLLLGVDYERINVDQKKNIRSSVRKMYNIAENDFVILSGGKIDLRKNVHLLIQAVNELENDNIKLILFGNVKLQIRSDLIELCKSEKIRYIGWINPDKIYDLLQASDLGAFPGTHSVLWEQAVGMGLPCIFKYWKGMNHIDIGGNCRFLYNDSSYEIKKILEEVTNNHDQYINMKNIAESDKRKKFSYHEIARKAIEY
jgi:glycosyltransferase involved in cell wall biosynthesis